MTLLTKEQIEARVALYRDLLDAVHELEELEKLTPEQAPTDLHVDSDYLVEDVKARADFVLVRAWPAMRNAILADAKKRVEVCEEAVRKFEAGEDV